MKLQYHMADPLQEIKTQFSFKLYFVERNLNNGPSNTEQQYHKQLHNIIPVSSRHLKSLKKKS